MNTEEYEMQPMLTCIGNKRKLIKVFIKFKLSYIPKLSNFKLT